MKKKAVIHEVAAATEANDVSYKSHPVAASLCEACASIGADSLPIRRGPQGRGYRGTKNNALRFQAAANDASCKSQPVAASLCEACASIGANSLPIRRGPQGRGYSATILQYE